MKLREFNRLRVGQVVRYDPAYDQAFSRYEYWAITQKFCVGKQRQTQIYCALLERKYRPLRLQRWARWFDQCDRLKLRRIA